MASPDMITTTATSMTPKVVVSVRSVPRDGGETRLRAIESASASTITIGRNRPSSIATIPTPAANSVKPKPAKALPLFAA